jgi:hypothetical protein
LVARASCGGTEALASQERLTARMAVLA